MNDVLIGPAILKVKSQKTAEYRMWHMVNCQMGRIAHLPAPTTPLPRAKPLPKPRAPTKWEQFAQRKGIVKKKRTKEVWDEQAGEYRRRYGYKRAADESEVPILEATADDQVISILHQPDVYVHACSSSLPLYRDSLSVHTLTGTACCK